EHLVKHILSILIHTVQLADIGIVQITESAPMSLIEQATSSAAVTAVTKQTSEQSIIEPQKKDTQPEKIQKIIGICKIHDHAKLTCDNCPETFCKYCDFSKNKKFRETIKNIESGTSSNHSVVAARQVQQHTSSQPESQAVKTEESIRFPAERNLFYHYQYSPRQITAGSTNNFLGIPRKTATVFLNNHSFSGNQPLQVIDVRPESQEELSDST
ncbi:13535_t:CDS:2, partial [Racocetra fulgida]